METTAFSKKEAIRFGWRTFKANWGFLFLAFLVAGIIYFFPGMTADRLEETMPFLANLIGLGVWVIYIVLPLGLIKITLKLHDNQKPELTDLLSCFPLFFKQLLASILYNLIVFFGLLLLIIPGIIWAVKFQFYSYLIVDRNLGPIKALKKSVAITRDHKWNLFLLSLILALIDLLGVTAIFAGLLIALPVTMLARTFVYRKLLAMAETTA